MTITNIREFAKAYELQIEANEMFDEYGRISNQLEKEMQEAFDKLSFDEVCYLHEIAIPKEDKEQFDHAFNNKD
jgi:predicted DNA-binding WGR domain protein